jgi:hypothetical protein
MTETQGGEPGQGEPARLPRDIPQCVTAGVTVGGGVGGGTDADAVEDDDRGSAGHRYRLGRREPREVSNS